MEQFDVNLFRPPISSMNCLLPVSYQYSPPVRAPRDDGHSIILSSPHLIGSHLRHSSYPLLPLSHALVPSPILYPLNISPQITVYYLPT